MDCDKGNLTIRARKEKRTMKESILELIHIDVCGLTSPSAMEGFKCFINFLNDYSRFGWVELLFEKFEAFDSFKKFKTTAKLKIGKLINCVYSNKGGEFYG